MSYDESNSTWPNVVRLDQIHHRYQLAVRSAPMPALSIEEIDVFFWGLSTDGQSGHGEPKTILIQWCDFRKQSEEYDWRSDLWYSTNYPGHTVVPGPPDTSVCDGLIRRIEAWTELERIKVIKVFEDLRNIHFNVLDLSPAIIYTLLAIIDGRIKQNIESDAKFKLQE